MTSSHCHGGMLSAWFLQANIQQLEAEVKSASDTLQSLENQVGNRCSEDRRHAEKNMSNQLPSHC